MEFIVQDNKSWDYKYIENHKAPAYHRIIIENLHTKKKDDLRSLIGNNMLRMKSIDRIEFVLTGLRSIEGLSNLEFIKALTKKYRVKITQKLDEDEVEEENKNINFFADNSVSIIDKIKVLSEEQGLVLTEQEIADYIR